MVNLYSRPLFTLPLSILLSQPVLSQTELVYRIFNSLLMSSQSTIREKKEKRSQPQKILLRKMLEFFSEKDVVIVVALPL